MAQFTFIELHVEDLSIAPNLPFSGADTADDTAADDQQDEQAAGIDDESGGGVPVKALALVLVLVGIVAVTSYLRSGSDGGGEGVLDEDSVDVAVGTSSE